MNRSKLSYVITQRTKVASLALLLGFNSIMAYAQQPNTAVRHAFDDETQSNDATILQVGNSGNVVMYTRDLRSDAQLSAMINKGLNTLRLPSLMPMPTASGKSTSRKYVPGRGWVSRTYDRGKLMEQYNKELTEKWGVAPWGKRTPQKRTASQKKTANRKSTAKPRTQPRVLKIHDQIIADLQSQSWNNLASRVDSSSIAYGATRSLLQNPAEMKKLTSTKEYRLWSSQFGTRVPSFLSQLLSGYELATTKLIVQDNVDSNHRELTVQILPSDGSAQETVRMSLIRKVVRSRNRQRQTVWKIKDISIPNQQLSLMELVQYRMIEASPDHPKIAQRMHPGRLLQSKEVEPALALDPRDTNFELQFDRLNADTQTWPLVVAKRARFLERQQVASSETIAAEGGGEATSQLR